VSSFTSAFSAGVLNLRQMDGVAITYQRRGRDGELISETPITSAGWIDRSGRGYQEEAGRYFPFAADVQIAKTDLADIVDEQFDTIKRDDTGDAWNIMDVNGRDSSASYLHLTVARTRKTSTRASFTQRDTRSAGGRNP